MERYETDDDDNLSDESASLYTSDELYLDDASDSEKEITSEGEESFLRRTRRWIIPSEFLTCTAAPDFSASQALVMVPGDMLHGLRAAAVWIDELDGRYFPQFHLDMGSLVGLPSRWATVTIGYTGRLVLSQRRQRPRTGPMREHYAAGEMDDQTKNCVLSRSNTEFSE
ncbi:hypothetical protein E4U14_008118 [Claviceps sp. LM454 group G7]|nr:hypothetical protein E4U14_008118 [Claviceps sp. LM454 group G7]